MRRFDIDNATYVLYMHDLTIHIDMIIDESDHQSTDTNYEHYDDLIKGINRYVRSIPNKSTNFEMIENKNEVLFNFLISSFVAKKFIVSKNDNLISLIFTIETQWKTEKVEFHLSKTMLLPMDAMFFAYNHHPDKKKSIRNLQSVFLVTTDPASGDIPKTLQQKGVYDDVIAVFSTSDQAEKYIIRFKKEYNIDCIYREAFIEDTKDIIDSKTISSNEKTDFLLDDFEYKILRENEELLKDIEKLVKDNEKFVKENTEYNELIKQLKKQNKDLEKQNKVSDELNILLEKNNDILSVENKDLINQKKQLFLHLTNYNTEIKRISNNFHEMGY